MKKLLFINGHMNCGGVEKALLNVLGHIDYNEYEVDLLLLEEIGDYREEIPKQVNVRLMSLQNTYGAWWKCLASCAVRRDWFSFGMRVVFLACRLFGQTKMKLAKKILDLPHYDTVVAFRSGICTQIAAYAIDGEKKLTWWHHGEIVIDKKEYEESAKEFDRIVVVTESCMRMLKEAFPAIRDKMIVVPNMLDPVEIERMSCADEAPQGLKTAGETFQITTVCRLSPEKHVENVISSAAQLKQQGIQFCWTIVGDGQVRHELEEEAAKQSLGDVIVFAGILKNPYPLLKKSNIYVHPSYVESQGISVLEALSLHIPCVVTESLGPKEYLVNEENVLLVERGSKALTNAILRLYYDNNLYHTIQRNSYCPEEFLPENVMRIIVKIL